MDIYDEDNQLVPKLIKSNLKQGLSVVGELCHSVAASKTAWQRATTNISTQFVNIAVYIQTKLNINKESKITTTILQI